MEGVKDFVEDHKVGLSVAVSSVVGLFLLKQFLRGGQCKSNVKLTGKTALITGANTGIGKETAIDFAKRGARVLLACRDLTRAEKAAKDVREMSGNNDVVVYKLDLASLESVRTCAAEILKKEKKLDILVNNAGLMWCPFLKTADGFELQFGTNHLGHFLFTNLLLDRIKESAPSRIVTVSSIGHELVKAVDFDNLNAEKNYNRVNAYSQSKLANILFSRELSKKLKGTGVTSNSLHPGAVDTELVRHIDDYPFYARWILKLLYYGGVRYLIKTSKDGAQTSIYLAVSEDVENVTGKYFSDCAIKEPTKYAQDDNDAARLWKVSKEMTGLE